MVDARPHVSVLFGNCCYNMFFAFKVNESEMSTLCHQNVVEAIRNSGEMLSLKVVTLPSENQTNGTVKGIRRGRVWFFGLKWIFFERFVRSNYAR